MNEVVTGNNEVLLKFAPQIEQQVNVRKKEMGVHHRRTQSPQRNHVKTHERSGEIYKMSLGTNKGEILGAHKGVGKYPEKRRPKPFINTVLEEIIPEMADELAETTGDVIGIGLVK